MQKKVILQYYTRRQRGRSYNAIVVMFSVPPGVTLRAAPVLAVRRHLMSMHSHSHSGVLVGTLPLRISTGEGDGQKTRTEEAEDPEHVGPLLEYLPMDCMRCEAISSGIGSQHMRTYARVRHDIEIVTQLLYPLEELCTRSLECGDGLEFFLLLKKLCRSSSVRHGPRQLGLAGRCHRSPHFQSIGVKA